MQTNFLLPLEDEDAPAKTLSLAEILSSLSYALDLTSGQVPGHAERTCLIGMRLGARRCGWTRRRSAACTMRC